MNPAIPSSPCPLGQLPDELLIAIISQLDFPRGIRGPYLKDNLVKFRALRALTLACRKFNAIATPALYRCVISPRERTITTHLLLRSLFHRPELCRHIESIFDLRDGNPNHAKAVTDADMTTYSQYLTGLTWARPSTGITSFPWDPANTPNFRRQDTAVLTLIALAENLREVVIPPSEVYYFILAHKRYTPSDGLRTLRLWQSSNMSRWISEYRASPSSSINPLAKLLRYDINDTSGAESSAAYQCDLVEIALEVDWISADELATRLMACRTLERFSCHWSVASHIHQPRSMRRVAKLNLPAMLRVLRRFQDSLASLTMNTMDAAFRSDLEEDVPAIGSLRDFVNLKYLEVSGLVLWGDCDGVDYPHLSDILPPSIEKLVIIVEWDDDIEDALYILHNECSASLPLLKNVTCTYDTAPRSKAEPLVEAFNQLGVELVLYIEENPDSPS